MAQSTKFIFFTSDRSEILDLVQWINANIPGADLLKNSERVELSGVVNYSVSYKDIMVVKLT